MSFIKDENGQGMLEYVLIIALVAVVAIVALIAVRTVLKNKNQQISSQMNAADAADYKVNVSLIKCVIGGQGNLLPYFI